VTSHLPANIAAAVKAGHTFESDAPANVLGSVSRWTCTTCGDAVLDSGRVIYGGATERTCEESAKFWAVTA
jgi:hypothetical protein